MSEDDLASSILVKPVLIGFRYNIVLKELKKIRLWC